MTDLIRDRLNEELPALRQKLDGPHFDALVDEFRMWKQSGTCGRLQDGLAALYSQPQPERVKQEIAAWTDFYEFLMVVVGRVRSQLVSMTAAHAGFQQAYRGAPSDRERRRLILKLASDLGAGRRQLAGDRKALDRWFDAAAVSERYHRRYAAAEQRLEYALKAIGKAGATLLGQAVDESRERVWNQLNLDQVYCEILSQPTNYRVQCAAHTAIAEALQSVSPVESGRLLAGSVLPRLQRAALDRGIPAWVQAAALKTLVHLRLPNAAEVLTDRLTRPAAGDDLFVRRCGVRLLPILFRSDRRMEEQLEGMIEDTSAYVRQAVATSLTECTDAEITRRGLERLMASDPAPAVRAAAVLAARTTARQADMKGWFADQMNRILQEEGHSFVVRTTLHVIPLWISELQESGEFCPLSHAIVQDIMPHIQQIRETDRDTARRRWAARAAERIWLMTTPAAKRLHEELRVSLKASSPRATQPIPRKFVTDSPLLGRVLAVIAQDDYGFEIERRLFGPIIRRGPQRRFRLWRLVLELLRPSPDKRQAHRHTVGRVSTANWRVPSGRMGELGQTMVPGEPLVQQDERTWRNFLPLVDDALSALNQWGWVRPVKFFTAEGVTTLSPPSGALKKISAWLRLTAHFQRFATSRNWQPSDSFPASDYVQSLRDVGFAVSFRPYMDPAGRPVAVDKTVLRFFAEESDASVGRDAAGRRRTQEPASQKTAEFEVAHSAGVPCLMLADSVPQIPAWLTDPMQDFTRYFTSVYENSLWQLLLFASGVLMAFFARQWWITRRGRLARRQFALSIGGWGTRGKSGTERLKAALVNALGVGLVSKTTGCDAMFLYASTYGELCEIPVYRPFGKATIWEHQNLLRLAADLNAPVFLWECMGLNPEYVEILQGEWTQDDIATITNAYPDHEDVQGPAGIDVAESIATFIPANAQLITTEYEMMPVLRSEAFHRGSIFQTAGWLESGLLPSDVLDRFPYNEHPDNIALVTRLAAELGCDEGFAVKEMADRVVPDLGVLKTFSHARVKTRTLEFSNGMSANERNGSLNNWRRLGFDADPVDADPEVWITTVINNRADRIARSQVFARMVVRDLAADCHVLIGTNLKGLRGYIDDEWSQFCSTLSLFARSGGETAATPARRLDRYARTMRVPTSAAEVRQSVNAMVNAVCETVRGRSDRERPNTSEDVLGDLVQLESRLRRRGIDDSLSSAVVRHASRKLEMFGQLQSLRELISLSGEDDREQIDARLRQVMTKWFLQKLIVIPDADADGEEILETILLETPPGMLNRIHGMQNIKGTGMDFVHRWLAWQRCDEACVRIESRQDDDIQRGIRALGDFSHFGILCRERLTHTLRECRDFILRRHPQLHTSLDEIDQVLNASESPEARQMRPSKRRGSEFAWWKEFRDSSRAVHHRRQVEAIYRDLIDERISTERARAQLADVVASAH